MCACWHHNGNGQFQIFNFTVARYSGMSVGSGHLISGGGGIQDINLYLWFFWKMFFNWFTFVILYFLRTSSPSLIYFIFELMHTKITFIHFLIRNKLGEVSNTHAEWGIRKEDHTFRCVSVYSCFKTVGNKLSLGTVQKTLLRVVEAFEVGSMFVFICQNVQIFTKSLVQNLNYCYEICLWYKL